MIQSYAKRVSRRATIVINDEKTGRMQLYVNIAWFSVFLAALAAAIYSVYLCIYEYKNASVVVSVSTPPQVSMSLPNIMLCYDGDIYGKDVDKLGISHLLKHYLAHGGFAIKPGTMIPNSVIEEFRQAKASKIIPSQFEFIRNYSFSCRELVVESFILVNVVDICKNAKLIFHPTSPYCWTFRDIGRQLYPGSAAGLRLRLRMPNASNSSGDYMGFTFDVFDPDLDFPPIFADYYLEPNTDVSVVVEMHQAERLKRLSWPKEGNLCETVSSEHSNVSCHYRCAAEAMEHYCGCVDHGLRHARPGARPCSLDEYKCLVLNGSIIIEKSSECNTKCLPPCHGRTYRSTITSRQLRDGSNKSDTMILMGFGALEYLLVEESEAYTLLTLLSNIGGTLGLYLGFSIIACVDICWAYARKRRRKLLMQKTEPGCESGL